MFIVSTVAPGLKLDGQGNFCFAEYFFGEKRDGLVRFGLKVKCCPLTLSDDSECTVWLGKVLHRSTE